MARGCKSFATAELVMVVLYICYTRRPYEALSSPTIHPCNRFVFLGYLGGRSSHLVFLEHLGEIPIVQVTAAGLRSLSAYCIQVRPQTLTQR